MAGKDLDHVTRDLHDSIAKGDFPSWTVYVQIMKPEEAKTYRFDSFDVTKVWSKKDYPMIPFGKMVLNRNPENYFLEVEQAGFSPGNLSDYDRTNLVKNIVTHMKNAQKRIQLRQAAIFYKANEDYGTKVAQGLGLDVNEVKNLASMTQEERVKKTIQ